LFGVREREREENLIDKIDRSSGALHVEKNG